MGLSPFLVVFCCFCLFFCFLGGLLWWWRRVSSGVSWPGWITSPWRCRLKLWDDVPVAAEQSAAHSPVTDVYDFTGPKISQHAASIFHRTQLSLPFILPLRDETTAAGINVQSYCAECLMSTVFSISLLHVVRTASCFLPPSSPQFIHQFPLCRNLFSIILRCFFSFHYCPTAGQKVADTYRKKWY